MINIVTILLGLSVGSRMSASAFLNAQTLQIIALGLIAFAIGTAAGVLMGKLMCVLTGRRVNPMIGAAGVSAVPMAARVVQKVGQDEDPGNFLLMNAMGPNVAGVIGSAVGRRRADRHLRMSRFSSSCWTASASTRRGRPGFAASGRSLDEFALIAQAPPEALAGDSRLADIDADAFLLRIGSVDHPDLPRGRQGARRPHLGGASAAVHPGADAGARRDRLRLRHLRRRRHRGRAADTARPGHRHHRRPPVRRGDHPRAQRAGRQRPAVPAGDPRVAAVIPHAGEHPARLRASSTGRCCWRCRRACAAPTWRCCAASKPPA